MDVNRSTTHSHAHTHKHTLTLTLTHCLSHVPKVQALGFGLLVPTLLGASVLVGIGLLNNLDEAKRYPQYWL